jgi:diphthamide biosynthesis protein 3
MAENIYDEIEIEDMTYDPTLEIYHYPCPCGDRFEIAIADLRDKEDIAVCPSCSLMIRVIFEVVSAVVRCARSGCRVQIRKMHVPDQDGMLTWMSD